MKSIAFFSLFLIASTAFSPIESDVEFVCLKTNKASNTCYFNFKIDGIKYMYVDPGCKRAKKRDVLIQKVKDGKLALSRDWKIDCPGSD